MEDIFDRIVEGVKKGASTVIKGASAVEIGRASCRERV